MIRRRLLGALRCAAFAALLLLATVAWGEATDGNEEEHPDDDPDHPQSTFRHTDLPPEDRLKCNVCKVAILPAISAAVEASQPRDDFEALIRRTVSPLSSLHVSDVETGEVIQRQELETGETEAQLDTDVHSFIQSILLDDHQSHVALIAAFRLWHSAPKKRHLWRHVVETDICPCDSDEWESKYHPSDADEFHDYIENLHTEIHEVWKGRGGHNVPGELPDDEWVGEDHASELEDVEPPEHEMEGATTQFDGEPEMSADGEF